MAENFPSVEKETDIQIQESLKVPNKMNPKRWRYSIMSSMSRVKDKESILKAARENQLVTYKGTPYDYHQIFQQQLCRQELSSMTYQKCWKEKKKKKLQPKILCPAKLSFRIEGVIKRFPETQKLKEFIATRQAIQEMLKGLFQPKKEKDTTRKAYKSTSLTDKGKYVVKFRIH